MRLRGTVLAVVITLLVGLVALAYASPTDQTWLPGIYDNADYDNVILMLTSVVGAADGVRITSACPIAVVATVVTLPSSRPADALRVPYHLRAPPLT
jgi:hypothetical protein